MLLLLTPAATAEKPSSKPDPVTAGCTFDDDKEMSVRYVPANSNQERWSNGKVWAPSGFPMLLFTPADLTLANSTIPAGAFSLYLIPGKQQWILVVNRNVATDSKYDEHRDLVRAPMEVGLLSQPAKELELVFAHTAPKECNLRIYFGDNGVWTEFKEK